MTGKQKQNVVWQKMKNADKAVLETMLREVEDKYVSACAKFITSASSGAASSGAASSGANGQVWLLRNDEKKINAMIINYKSTLMPVLCGKKEIPALNFCNSFFDKKKIHSVQGLTNEVIVIEKIMEQTGNKIKDIFDYDLMSLDKKPEEKYLLGHKKIILRLPKMTDIDAIAPLQAGYEQEEVLPKGSVFSPAASRINITNIIASGQILAAELDGRLVGKINVSAVSFSRFLVGGVYVHPDYRSMGIAKMMASAFIGSLIDQGRGVTLFVKKTNIPARRLYTSLGFKINGDYRITYF